MSRFVYGPGANHLEQGPDLAAAGVQPVTIRGIRRGGYVDLTLGPVAADGSAAAISNAHAVYLDAPPAVDSDPKAVLDGAALKGQLDAAALAAGGDVTIQVAPAPTAGRPYFVQTILEIPDAPAAAAPPAK